MNEIKYIKWSRLMTNKKSSIGIHHQFVIVITTCQNTLLYQIRDPYIITYRDYKVFVICLIEKLALTIIGFISYALAIFNSTLKKIKKSVNNILFYSFLHSHVSLFNVWLSNNN